MCSLLAGASHPAAWLMGVAAALHATASKLPRAAAPLKACARSHLRLHLRLGRLRRAPHPISMCINQHISPCLCASHDHLMSMCITPCPCPYVSHDHSIPCPCVHMRASQVLAFTSEAATASADVYCEQVCGESYALRRGKLRATSAVLRRVRDGVGGPTGVSRGMA